MLIRIPEPSDENNTLRDFIGAEKYDARRNKTNEKFDAIENKNKKEISAVKKYYKTVNTGLNDTIKALDNVTEANRIMENNRIHDRKILLGIGAGLAGLGAVGYGIHRYRNRNKGR